MKPNIHGSQAVCQAIGVNYVVLLIKYPENKTACSVDEQAVLLTIKNQMVYSRTGVRPIISSNTPPAVTCSWVRNGVSSTFPFSTADWI